MMPGNMALMAFRDVMLDVTPCIQPLTSAQPHQRRAQGPLPDVTLPKYQKCQPRVSNTLLR